MTASQNRDLPAEHWQTLAAAADTLCLTELLDTDQPAEDPTDPVYAAQVVHQHTFQAG